MNIRANFFANLFGGDFAMFQRPFPDKLVMVDFETSGLHVHEGAVIVQVGYAVAEGGNVIDHGGYLLQPPAWAVFSPGAVAVHGITEEICKKAGQPFRESLTELAESVSDLTNSGYHLVGHNVVGFDLSFLMDAHQRVGVPRLSIDPSRLWDTGMLAKAAVQDNYPHANENRAMYYDRVAAARIRFRWNLARCCELCGIGDEIQFHDAANDCLASFRVLQRMFWLADHPEAQNPFRQ